MSELRYDPVFGQWNCIAENRQSRPFEFQQLTRRRAGIDCPFCRGNESATPPPLEEWTSAGRASGPVADWLVRVLPNKYPAIDQSLAVCPGGPPPPASYSGGGFQEVIVLSPRHVASLSGLNDAELFASFAALQSRLNYYLGLPGIRHTCIFMNCRPMAGASIEHAHIQLIASPVCTQQVQSRIQRMDRDSGHTPRQTVWEHLLKSELDHGARVIQQADELAVFCPFASRYSSQIRIAPLVNRPFAEMSAERRDPLALLCRKWIHAMERCLQDVAWNLIFHLPPAGMSASPWFVDLVPRFPQAAGFELATDCWVNPVSPETAASQYRKFDAQESNADQASQAP